MFKLDHKYTYNYSKLMLVTLDGKLDLLNLLCYLILLISYNYSIFIIVTLNGKLNFPNFECYLILLIV